MSTLSNIVYKCIKWHIQYICNNRTYLISEKCNVPNQAVIYLCVIGIDFGYNIIFWFFELVK
jgi:hypothetical protein